MSDPDLLSFSLGAGYATKQAIVTGPTKFDPDWWIELQIFSAGWLTEKGVEKTAEAAQRR